MTVDVPMFKEIGLRMFSQCSHNKMKNITQFDKSSRNLCLGIYIFGSYNCEVDNKWLLLLCSSHECPSFFSVEKLQQPICHLSYFVPSS